MRKLEGIVIVKEEIVVDGHINDKGKVIAPTKTKYSAKPRTIAEDYILNDPTAEIIGDAYEVFDTFEGRRRRNVVQLERAEEIEASQGVKTVFNKAEKLETVKTSNEPKEKATKKEPKKTKTETVIESEKENISKNITE
jgi:hypothetical protein